MHSTSGTKREHRDDYLGTVDTEIVVLLAEVLRKFQYHCRQHKSGFVGAEEIGSHPVESKSGAK